MHFKTWQSKLLVLWQQRNSTLVFASGLLLLALLQTVALVSLVGRWHTVVVPAGFSRTFWVDQSSISESYLAQMSEYFATLMLDVTPENVKFQREALLQYVDPSYYGALQSQLLTQEEKITTQSIATAFYPVDMAVDTKHLRARITGDIHTFVGATPVSQQRQSYMAEYAYRHGRLLLQQFREVKPEEK